MQTEKENTGNKANVQTEKENIGNKPDNQLEGEKATEKVVDSTEVIITSHF